MSVAEKLLSVSWRNKLQPGLASLFPFLLALDRDRRREAIEDKQSLIEQYKTLSWPHLNLSLFSDLIELKLANDLTGKERPAFISVLGGSKTGKSFLFNHLLGEQLAPSGVSVTTHSVLLYLHQRWSRERLADRYFPRPGQDLLPLKRKEALCDRLVHRIYCQEHKNDAYGDFALLDTPDFNREDDENVRLAYRVLALSDIILYVFTAETYADAGGTTVARIAYECGKTIIPVYNMVDNNLLDQPARLEEDYRIKIKEPQEHDDGTITPPPYPFFPDHFFAVSWVDVRKDPKASVRIEPIGFSSGKSCVEILGSWADKEQFLSLALPHTLAKASELLDTVNPDLEKVFNKLDRIRQDLGQLGQPLEVEFPLAEAARAIYEVLEGFRPEAINRFLAGVDKVHEKTVRFAIEWIRKRIIRDHLTEKSPQDLAEKRLCQESKRIMEACVSFADSVRHTGWEYGLFLFDTLKLSPLDSRREELEKEIYHTLREEDALEEVKQEMTADMAKNPARGFLVYSGVAMRISAVAGAIILSGEGIWLENMLWGTLGEVLGQPLAKMFIGRIGGVRLLERYKARRRQRYQEIIEEIVLTDTLAVLQSLPDRENLKMTRQLLKEMGEVSIHIVG